MRMQRTTHRIEVGNNPDTITPAPMLMAAMRSCILVVGVCLGGCAAGNPVIQNLPDQNLPDATVIQNLPDASQSAELSEPNYRQIVADNIGTIFQNPAELGVLEISNVRQADHLQGLAWLTCLRIHAGDAPREYAVFIIGDKIVDARTGVAIDRCKQQTYGAFDLASFLQPKIAPKQSKKTGH
jgi:hypothetical protein